MLIKKYSGEYDETLARGEDLPNDEQIAQWKSEEYKRKRAPEYPSIEDQLDDLFHAGAFTEAMTAKIQAVKDKYPKPE